MSESFLGELKSFLMWTVFLKKIYKTAHHVIENVMFETCRSVGIKSAIDCHSPIRQNKFRQPCELDSLVRRLASFMIQQKNHRRHRAFHKTYLCFNIIITIWVASHKPSEFIPCFFVAGDGIWSPPLFIPDDKHSNCYLFVVHFSGLKRVFDGQICILAQPQVRVIVRTVLFAIFSVFVLSMPFKVR